MQARCIGGSGVGAGVGIRICCWLTLIVAVAVPTGLRQGRFYQEPSLLRSRRAGLFLAGLAGPLILFVKVPVRKNTDLKHQRLGDALVLIRLQAVYNQLPEKDSSLLLEAR